MHEDDRNRPGTTEILNPCTVVNTYALDPQPIDLDNSASMRGRPKSSHRQWVEDCSVIDAVESRQSCREAEYWAQHKPRSIFLTMPDSSWSKVNVKLTTTQPNYGGTRYWFVCPRPGCGHRVAKLYVTDSGIWGCRRCLNLAYECQYRRSRKYWQRTILREYLKSLAGPSRFEKLLARHGQWVFG